MTGPVAAPRSALVLGGNSDIAHAVLWQLAAEGLDRVVLAARDTDAVRVRLQARPLPIINVIVEEWDALDVGAHGRLIERAVTALGTIDLVLCAVGSLGHSAGIDTSTEGAAALFESNFAGPATAITAAARPLAAQGHGTIVVFSSVAGLRARRSNYLYGSAKAGLDTFTQGLADAMRGKGVRVHLIRPGFVHSKMTAGLRPAPFATTTDAVAAAVVAAVVSGRSRIVHVPRLLGPLFAVLGAVPRPIWRRIAGDR